MKKRIVVLMVAFFLIILGNLNCGIGITNSNENEFIVEQNKTENIDDVNIDPNIRLTKSMLPRLKLAVEKIDNPIDKKLVDRIIQTLENKGVVYSEDIKNILNEINSDYKNVYWFSVVSGGSAGLSWCSSFPMLPSLFILKGAFWIGPALFLSWNADSWPSNNNFIYVKGNLISEDHRGFALLPVGAWASTMGFDPSGKPGTGCTISAFSPLIFIS